MCDILITPNKTERKLVKMKNKVLSIFLALVLSVGILPLTDLTASAAVSWPGFSDSKPIKAFTISNQNNTVAYSSNSLTSKKGTIYATDELHVYSIGKNSSGVWYAYCSYPVKGGRKYAFIPLSAITSASSPSLKGTAIGTATTYRRPNNSSKAGSIAVGDVVYLLSTSGSYKQVLYNIGSINSPSGYRLAWLKTSDYNAIVKSSNSSTTSQKSSAVENGVKYTYVTTTLDVSNLTNWTSSLLKVQNGLPGTIVSQAVKEYRPMKISEPIQGPAINGKSPTKTTTINIPYKVTFKVHSHERKMGFLSAWKIENGCVVTQYLCECGYQNTILMWDIPIPNRSEYVGKQIKEIIKMQASQYYWINNVK